MSQARAARLKYLALSTAESARNGRRDAQSAQSFEHGVNAYRSGKCRCKAICLPAHTKRTAEVKEAKANGTWQPKRKNAVTPEADAFALYLLEDGATYREAATSAGVDQHQLAKRHPGFGRNRNEFATVMAQIRRVPKLLDLHREIWQKGQAA